MEQFGNRKISPLEWLLVGVIIVSIAGIFYLVSKPGSILSDQPESAGGKAQIHEVTVEITDPELEIK